jgi:hypothetical protein
MQQTSSFWFFKSNAYVNFCGFEPGGREFESLRARTQFEVRSGSCSASSTAFFFSTTNAGFLRDTLTRSTGTGSKEVASNENSGALVNG